MADCSYSRCVQERRNIRRELQKWTKNMVYIVGLERIAEELMGRRKWKLYQDCMSRNQQPSSQLHPITNNNNNNVLLDDSNSKTSSTTTTVKQEPENDEQERLKDWSPQSKCYFCVDGKLDSDHTTHGALSPRPSDSDSSDSPSDSEAPPTLTPPAAALHLLKNNHHPHPGTTAAHHLPSRRGIGVHPSMTTIESVSSMASLAAVAALTGGSGVGPQATQVPFAYQPLFAGAPTWYLNSLARNIHQQQHKQQQHQQEHMDVDKAGGEQPLDLSSKPSNSATININSAASTPTSASAIDNKLRLSALDTKHIFKAKPRMSAVGGRRTYTEEELQAALRDIQSGKLGTRRAAVIYGIPRSTLRNKVYKMAMERERESHLTTGQLSTLTPLVADEDVMDDDKELSGAEEEKEVEKALQGPLLSMADIVRFSNINDSPEALRALLIQQQQQLKNKDGVGSMQDLWAGMEHSAVGPYIQLIMPEIMRKLITEEQHLNNGDNNDTKSLSQPSPSNSVKAERIKTDSMSDMDTDESPSNVILKIPSFKPSKNGGDTYRNETGAIVSPPVTSESGSPPIGVTTGNMLSLREAIAKSISQKFQQSPEPLKIHPGEIDFKRVGITPPLSVGIPTNSIIKNHQTPSEPPTPPASVPAIQPATIVHTRNFPPTNSTSSTTPNNNIAKQTNNNNNNNSGSSSSSGGKGTRPKRGKYRNYDRDSLVEAVRAVQRGEMSVHRAGSYYGVPHSTLEYKVKERHLMRPRKRDPKPNPVDEKIASMKNQEIRNIPDKMKPVIKPPQKFSPTSPNGMKMPPMFDPAITAFGCTPPPFPFWPHPSFTHLPLDYPRNPSTSQFPPSPEFYASQMMQRLQEQSVRCHPDAPAGSTGVTGANGSSATSTTSSGSSSATLAKSAREMAESLYDGTGANGSFLDGIIRSSLESGVPHGGDKANNKEDPKNIAPENMSNKALLDQLCRNSRMTPLQKPNSVNIDPNSSGDESYRKTSSPLNFATKTKENDNNGKCRDDIQTIEISNDSNDSNTKDERVSPSPPQQHLNNSNNNSGSTQQSPPSRIYVKPQFQELTKPENLKPEVLVRFRATADECDEPESMLTERNGILTDATTGSASDIPDVAQD